MRMSTSEHFSNAVTMRRLLYGRIVSAALCTAAELRLPDLLHEGPKTADELAARTDAHPGALRRLMRALVAFDVVAERADGAYELTALGGTLRSDVPGTALPTALLAGELGRAWDALGVTVRSGGPAFDATFGTDFFTYLGTKPDLRETFYASQAADLDLTLEELAAVGFASYGTIVDVGGGDGALLAQVLAACPGSRGVLVDLPAVVPEARERMAAAGLADRCEVVAGDFFASVPSGGDLYVLRDVLHDWPDERCVELLAACRRSMPATAGLLIIERVVDEDATAWLGRVMDLYMLCVLDGRERTLAEFQRLLGAAGFTSGTCHRLSAGAVGIMARPGETGQEVAMT